MGNALKHEIQQLRDEAQQLKRDALDGTGDAVQRWNRALEIREMTGTMHDGVADMRASKREPLEEALAQIKNSLIFLLADSNRPAEVAGPPESTDAAVQRIYAGSLTIARDFATGEGDREDLSERAEAQQRELRTLADGGATDDPEWQRMLSTANLDLTYVLSGGTQPHSTRLAHLLAEAE